MSKEIKIGLTAVIAIVLLYLIINFMKGVNIFKSSNTYYVTFDDVAGLAVSNSVYANGYPVGIVRTIEYDYKQMGRVVVGVEVDKAMRIPRGTTAELQTSLMGGVSMHLLLGPNPTDNIAKGDTINGGLHEGALTKAEQLVPTVMDMAPKLDSIVGNLQDLTSSSALPLILHNAAGISEELRMASTKLNQMVGNDVPALMQRLGSVSANLEKLSGNLSGVDVEKTMAQVDSSLTEVKQFASNINQLSSDLNDKLTSKDNSLGLLMNDRHLYDNLNSTAAGLNRAVASGDSLLTDFKAHPKRYIHFSVFGKKDK